MNCNISKLAYPLYQWIIPIPNITAVRIISTEIEKRTLQKMSRVSTTFHG